MGDGVDDVNAAKPVFGLEAYDTTAGAEEGAVMEVVGPHGGVLHWPDGRPCTITFYGADSGKLQKLTLDQEDRRLAVMFRTQQPQASQRTLSDIIEQVVVATKSWDIPLADGTPAKNDPKEYRAAYVRYKWLRENAVAFVGARANFLKTAPKP